MGIYPIPCRLLQFVGLLEMPMTQNIVDDYDSLNPNRNQEVRIVIGMADTRDGLHRPHAGFAHGWANADSSREIRGAGRSIRITAGDRACFDLSWVGELGDSCVTYFPMACLVANHDHGILGTFLPGHQNQEFEVHPRFVFHLVMIATVVTVVLYAQTLPSAYWLAVLLVLVSSCQEDCTTFFHINSSLSVDGGR